MSLVFFFVLPLCSLHASAFGFVKARFFLLQLVSRAGLDFPPMVWTAGVAAVMCQRPSRCVRCTSCEDHLRYNICYRTPRWAATVLG